MGPVFTAQASADGAIVYNLGNNGSNSCSIGGFGRSYSGFSTTVFRDSSLKFQQCHSKLVSGTPVDQTQVVHLGSCTFVFTPEGIANSACAIKS